MSQVHHDTSRIATLLLEIIEHELTNLLRGICSLLLVPSLLPWVQSAVIALAWLIYCTVLLAMATNLLHDISATPIKMFGRFRSALTATSLLSTYSNAVLSHDLRHLTTKAINIGTRVLRSLTIINAFLRKEVDETSFPFNWVLRFGLSQPFDPRQPNVIRWHYSIRLSSMFIHGLATSFQAANLIRSTPTDANDDQSGEPQWIHWTLIAIILFWPWLRLFRIRWASTPVGPHPSTCCTPGSPNPVGRHTTQYYTPECPICREDFTNDPDSPKLAMVMSCCKGLMCRGCIAMLTDSDRHIICAYCRRRRTGIDSQQFDIPLRELHSN